jgi:hypothetical protein
MPPPLSHTRLPRAFVVPPSRAFVVVAVPHLSGRRRTLRPVLGLLRRVLDLLRGMCILVSM